MSAAAPVVQLHAAIGTDAAQDAINAFAHAYWGRGAELQTALIPLLLDLADQTGDSTAVVALRKAAAELDDDDGKDDDGEADDEAPAYGPFCLDPVEEEEELQQALGLAELCCTARALPQDDFRRFAVEHPQTARAVLQEPSDE